MLDGFMQRFGFIIADAERTPEMFPIYRLEEDANLDPLRKAWTKLAALPLHPAYIVDRDAENAFIHEFKRQYRSHADMPSSFFRRVMWRTFKYALVYHVLLGKADDRLDAEDIGWATRVSAMHLADSRRLLDRYNLTELEAVVVKAEVLQAKLGRKPTTRELISGVRGIKNANSARFIMELMKRPDNDNGENGERACGQADPPLFISA